MVSCFDIRIAEDWLYQAKRMHTNLDLFLVFFFLVHVLISTKFVLARWRVGHERLV